MDDFQVLTLGVVTHKHHWRDPEGIKLVGGFGCQIEEISRYFDKIVLTVPFKEQQLAPGYILTVNNLEIVPLSYLSGRGLRGKLGFFLKMPSITRQVWTSYGNSHIMHYRIPGYVGVLGLLIHRIRRSKPGFVWVGGDWPERIRVTKDNRIRRLGSRFVAYLLPLLTKDLSVFALGYLYQDYQSSTRYAHSIVSTVLFEADIVQTVPLEFELPFRLMFVGRLAPEKGIAHLLQAIADCRQKGADIELYIIGDGPDMEKLKDLVKDYGIVDKVIFKGFIPLGEKLWDEYRRANAFVLPSLSEGQGKTLIEAMSQGLPIIATRVGGIPTIIEDGMNGLLVEPGNPQTIAHAIERIYNEPETRKYLAENALNSVREYTIEAQTKRMMTLLAQDLSKQGWYLKEMC